VAGLQFAKPAPALDAHLLPLQLGEVQGGGPGGAITALSWDVASSHLAVALGGTPPRGSALAVAGAAAASGSTSMQRTRTHRLDRRRSSSCSTSPR